MTTLAERAKIERDALGDPAAPPSGSTQQEVEAANLLLSRIRAATLKAAENILSDATEIPAAGLERDKIGWARFVLAQPETVQLEMLRALLAKYDTSTVAQVAAVEDGPLLTAVEEFVPRLAAGRGISR